MAKLNQYRGLLSIEDSVAGISCAMRNAARLAKDARLLLDAERYPTACSLAILSIDEGGKIRIIRQLAVGGDKATVKGLWREYTTHTEKNYLWQFVSLYQEGARHLQDFDEVFDKDGVELANNLKQLGFYSGCFGNKNWSNPEEVVSQKLATMMVETAETLNKDDKSIPSIREIELFVKHMKPVQDAPDQVQVKAIEDWYQAMIDEGLRSDEDNRMRSFIRGDAPTNHGEPNG